MALVKLTTCWNSFEAEVIKGVLQIAGIPCMLQGASFSDVQMGTGSTTSASEVPVFVNEQDLEDALKVIAKDSEADTTTDK